MCAYSASITPLQHRQRERNLETRPAAQSDHNPHRSVQQSVGGLPVQTSGDTRLPGDGCHYAFAQHANDMISSVGDDETAFGPLANAMLRVEAGCMRWAVEIPL
jgi:hypothetical protein